MQHINIELHNYIYNEMEVENDPNYTEVRSNLKNGEEENLNYIGTYFPRSFKESYQIYKDIFSDEDIFNEFNKKHNIDILDIASGTGGNLFGLLQVLTEEFKNKIITIISIDGNEDALKKQLELFEQRDKFLDTKSDILNLVQIRMVFKNKERINQILSAGKIKYDIIHSFKFLNELYNDNYTENQGSYKVMLECCENKLKENGVLCLVDVTCKIPNEDYMSIIMNKECRDYLIENDSNLSYILPVCCSKNYLQCEKTEDCFSRYDIDVNIQDEIITSKINYKLFIKDELGIKISEDIKRFSKCSREECHCKTSEEVHNCLKHNDGLYKLF